MKACPQFEEQLIDAAAGAAETVPTELASHLSYCQACIERFARERQLFAAIDAGLAASVAAEPSPEFSRQVMEQVSGEGERRLLAAIDAGIAKTVEAEPSPQFAAAVRSRLTAEAQVRTPWSFFRLWMPVTGLVAASVLLVLLLRGTPPQRPVGRGNEPPSPVTATQVEPPLTNGANAETPGKTAAGKSRQAQPLHSAEPAAMFAAADTNTLPEVLIPAEEQQVVVRFYRFVQEGRINTAQVLEANRVELAQKLGEMRTPALLAQVAAVKTLDLVDSPRSTSDEK